MRLLAAACLASLAAPAMLVGCLQIVGVTDWEQPSGTPGLDAGPDGQGSGDDADADADADHGMPSYENVVLSDGPVAYYRFEEASPATTAHNEIGVPDGTYINMPALGAPGILAGSYGVALNGSNQYVEIGDFFRFDGNAPFSAEIWVQPKAGGTEFQQLLGNLNFINMNFGTGWGVMVHYPSTGGDPFIIAGRWVNEQQLCFVKSMNKPLIPPYPYTHVVVTFDFPNLMLYVDGSLQDADTCISGDGGLPGLPDAGQPLEIGVNSSIKYSFVEGLIDEAAIYDKALPSKRILAHFNAGSTK